MRERYVTPVRVAPGVGDPMQKSARRVIGALDGPPNADARAPGPPYSMGAPE